MTKQSRHQPVISRQSDEGDDHWLRQFEASLQKSSVQPRGKSVYDEITSIMNTKSKYPSVQAAVDDMMHRSGLSNYLDTVKESQEQIPEEKATKTAQFVPGNDVPKVIRQVPGVAKTIENIVRESKGNLPLSAILQRVQALHSKDASSEGVWDDEQLIRYISQKNTEAKANNPGVFENYDSLGKTDHANLDSDIDESNTDAFNILMPAKI